MMKYSIFRRILALIPCMVCLCVVVFTISDLLYKVFGRLTQLSTWHTIVFREN